MPSTRLRNRRSKTTGTTAQSQDEEEVTVEMSGYSTLTVILLLLFIGASGATLYITTKNPGCLGSGSSTIETDKNLRTSGSLPASIPKAPLPSPAEAVTQSVLSPQSAPLPPAQPPALKGFPATCTPEELNAVRKQLTPEACNNSPPYTQSCSFTMATAKNGCIDETEYFRKPLAGIDLATPFRAVLVGLKEKNQESAPMDMLALGNHDFTKYSLDKWYQASQQLECKLPPVEFAAGSTVKGPATVHILDASAKLEATIQPLKKACGLTDEEIKEDTTLISGQVPSSGSPTMDLDAWAKTGLPDQSPIHYLRFFASDSGAEALKKSSEVLKRTWFLEFDLDWKAGWARGDFKMTIQETLQKQAGMACYWRGTKGNLWRITDCWHDHYNKKSWSFLVCVNTQIPETKPIQDKMEEVFHETIKKPLVY